MPVARRSASTQPAAFRARLSSGVRQKKIMKYILRHIILLCVLTTALYPKSSTDEEFDKKLAKAFAADINPKLRSIDIAKISAREISMLSWCIFTGLGKR